MRHLVHGFSRRASAVLVSMCALWLRAALVSNHYPVFRVDFFACSSFAAFRRRRSVRSDTPFPGVRGCSGISTPTRFAARRSPYGVVPREAAAAVIVASEVFAKQQELPVLARIRSMAVVGLEPATMGLGPVSASKLALEKAGIKASELDVVEINEAFAAQAIPCVDLAGFDKTKVNMEGGAIALGHPLGASGARITGKAAQLLHRNKGKYALAAACIGGGMGIATVLERA